MDYCGENTELDFHNDTRDLTFTLIGADNDVDEEITGGIQCITENNNTCYICTEEFVWHPNPDTWTEEEGKWRSLPIKPNCSCKTPICYGCLWNWLNEEKTIENYDENGDVESFELLMGWFDCPHCRDVTESGKFLKSAEDYQAGLVSDDEEEEDEELPEIPNTEATIEEHQLVIDDLIKLLMKANRKKSELRRMLKNSEKARKALRTSNKKLRDEKKKNQPAKRGRAEISGILIEPANKKQPEPIDLDDEDL